jgi:hypothetical protein
MTEKGMSVVLVAEVTDPHIVTLTPRVNANESERGEICITYAASPSNNCVSLPVDGQISPTRINISRQKKKSSTKKKGANSLSPSTINTTCNNDNSNSKSPIIEDEEYVIKSSCRYGAGCTHIADPSHREKFWHPPLQEMTGQDSSSLTLTLSLTPSVFILFRS